MNLMNELEKLVNYLLSLDEESRAQLSGYAGSLIAVDLVDTGLTIYARVTAEGFALASSAETEPDVVIRGTPVALVNHLAAMKSGDPGKAAAIEITGDISLAQDVQAVFRRLEPDWEERLSGWIGDSLAHKAGYAARRGIELVKNADRKLKTDLSEYLRFEREVVVDRPDVEDFNGSVDRLRDDVERLKARIDRLQRRPAGH